MSTPDCDDLCGCGHERFAHMVNETEEGPCAERGCACKGFTESTNVLDSYVLDASMAAPEGTFCFCPVEIDRGIVTQIVYGMNILASEPPGRFVGVTHRDGQEACDRWVDEHREVVQDFLDRFGPEGASVENPSYKEERNV